MTIRDLLEWMLRESGVISAGQVPLAQDINDAFKRVNVLLGQWQRKRWMVYQLVDVVVKSNGQSGYSIGPNQQFNINTRPARVYSGFFRQYTGTGAQPQIQPLVVPGAYQDAATYKIILRDNTSPGAPFYSPTYNLLVPATVPVGPQPIPAQEVPTPQPSSTAVDYPLRVITSREDYSGISLKGLQSWPQSVWLETGWPIGTAWFYPTPIANLFELHLQLEVVLQTFSNLTDEINLPPEYEAALLYNMIVRTRSAYGAAQDNVMIALAKDALATVRQSNTQIPNMRLPQDLVATGRYNIFSDNADR